MNRTEDAVLHAHRVVAMDELKATVRTIKAEVIRNAEALNALMGATTELGEKVSRLELALKDAGL
jgi:hypothetical protein